MREIKFRAWLTLSERMIEEPFHFEVYHYSDENRINQKAYRCYEDWRELEDGRSSECVLLQYTGIGDRNCKDIYEGDIIEVDWLDARYKVSKHLVEWDSISCSFSFPGGSPYNDAVNYFTVIGNKFQNPELIPTK